jgi:hypothetical protein
MASRPLIEGAMAIQSNRMDWYIVGFDNE